VLHDLNKLLDLLMAGRERRLPTNLQLSPLHRSAGQPHVTRTCSAGDLNQAWRYGGKLEPPENDSVLEGALERVHAWLEGELR
jgi:hypothetical protein